VALYGIKLSGLTPNLVNFSPAYLSGRETSHSLAAISYLEPSL
jgi:hypothetical protein